jgi:hypothetical protein
MKGRLPPGRRGRPPKFGRRGQVVATTLPEEVVRGLRKEDPDLGWAIVALFERVAKLRTTNGHRTRDAELVGVGGRRSLIVVNRELLADLPGVNIIPLDGNRAFLTLEAGRGMSDLELAVIDRLQSASITPRERKALLGLRSLLRKWRRDRTLRCETRAIIVVERKKRT